MSTASLIVAEGNPVTLEVLRRITDTHLPGIKFSERDEKDYLLLLQALHTSVDAVFELPDYLPDPNVARFPRTDIHLPRAAENKLNGWAYRVTVQDSQPNEGPLKGRTFAVKDNYAVAGLPANNGTSGNGDWIPELDAEIVSRCLRAGAILKGKATTENNSCCPSSFSSTNGAVHNPYCKGRTTGGSSSGCAALVGGGEVDMALGADQGGSIRMPAAFCGIIGLKPTTGLVPYTGIMSLDYNIDHAGPMTRNVMDNALLLSVIAGDDGIDDRQGPGVPLKGQTPKYHEILEANKEKGVKGMKIGILTEGFDWPLMDPRVAESVKTATKKFEELGAIVEEVSIPRHKLAPSIWAAGMRLSSSLALKGFQSGRRQLFFNDLQEKKFPLTQEKADNTYCAILNLIIGGSYSWETFGPSFYGKAMNLTREIKDMYDAKLEEYDILITPTTPFVANLHAEPSSGPVAQISKSLGQNVNTGIFNSTGHPGLSIPCGMLTPNDGADADVKLPVGMQLIGKFYDEQTLYQAAYAWEQAFDWKEL